MIKSEKHTKHSISESKSSSAGLIVLQWLTYVFWGWTILSLVWLIFIVLASFITKQDTSEMVPYAIAATLVLLPISAICEFFYGRREPVKKTGAAMIVMVIHAVIFALFGIGMLIAGVLTVVQTVIGTNDGGRVDIVWILTWFISAAIYAVAFLRVLNPFPRLRLAKVYLVGMILVVGGFIVLGFVGPVMQAQHAKSDRKTEDGVSNIENNISGYVLKNNALPQSLSEVSLALDSKKLVDDGVIKYKQDLDSERDNAEATETLKGVPKSSSNEKLQSVTFRYQLCAVYKYETLNYNRDQNSSEYQEYVYPNEHPSGEVCYKIEKSVDY